MKIIEPCCARKHMMELRDAIGRSGTMEFMGYGDLSLTELLPSILVRYSQTRMMIVAPSVPDQAAEVIAQWMRKQWARMDGRGRLDAVSHLTVVTDAGSSPVLSQWILQSPFGDRLTVVDRRQDDTAILLPDFAVTGPVNMRYGSSFTATATTEAARVEDLWEYYGKLAEKPVGRKSNRPPTGSRKKKGRSQDCP